MISDLDELVSDRDCLFLHAHPDDEALLSGGLISRLASQESRRVVVVYLSAAAHDWPSHVRQLEARAACEVLGVTDVLWVDVADGQLPQNKDSAVSYVSRLVDRSMVVFGYDKQGGYGHPDHRAAHEVLAALDNHGISTLQVTIYRERFLRLLSLTRKARVKPDTSMWRVPEIGTPGSDLHATIHLTDVELGLKHTALSMHQSQMSATDFPLALQPVEFRAWFGEEYLA